MNLLRHRVVWLYVAFATLAGAALMAATLYFLAPDAACTPEEREAALQSDGSQVLSGLITINEAVNREGARMARCGD